MNEFFAFLDKISPLSQAIREYFLTVMVERNIRRNEFLVKAGQINNNLYFINKGLVRCYYLKKDEREMSDREVSIYFFMENDVIASTWSYINQKPGQEWMIALEDCSICSISFSDLDKAYTLFPELNLHGRLVTQKYSTLWYTILRGIRTQTAKERYQFLLDHFPRFLQRVPGKYLASYLGINAVTLSRIKKKK